MSERHRFLVDFNEPPHFSSFSPIFQFGDPVKTIRLNNVNEVWLEIQNLLYGARLNFATARTLRQLEDGYSKTTAFDANAKFDLHMDKMERFHLALFELARIEDLIVRLVYEFFGDQFIEVDTSKEDWEKKLTWDEMKSSLNKRGKPSKNPHPALEAMEEQDYQPLMKLIRNYRSPDVMHLTRYRDIRTHRVSPSVDHPELAVIMTAIPETTWGMPMFSQATMPDYEFLDLYHDAKAVYAHLLETLTGLNKLIHA